MKKIVCFMLCVSLIFSFNFSSFEVVALDSINTDSSVGRTEISLSEEYKQIIQVSIEDAKKIAASFVVDMILTGNVCWSNTTKIVSAIPMYNFSDEIMAYTIDLTSGYVVVSAFYDTSLQILEWSDKIPAIYHKFRIGENDRIIYYGGYEYYLKRNSTVLNLYEDVVDKNDIVDMISVTRDIKNIPDSILNKTNRGHIIGDGIDPNNIISNMLTHANENYTGNFVHSYHWDIIEYHKNNGYPNAFMPYYTNSYPLQHNYNGPCGPVAITNALITYRITTTGSSIPSDDDALFRAVANCGIREGYYVRYGASAGTDVDYMTSYALDAFLMYSIHPGTTQYSLGLGSYETFKYNLESNNFIIINTKDDQIYNDHGVFCHGFTRFRSQTTGAYLSYLHLADGIYPGPRYIPMAWCLNYESVVIDAY